MAAPAKPLVVGPVWSADSLRAAGNLTALGAPDLIELRVDHFADDPAALDALVAARPRPFIVTVRHPEEGGAGSLTFERREQLYGRFMDAAGYVDLEIRSMDAMAGVWMAAGDAGCRRIASFHDFQGTPPLEELQRMAAWAFDVGANVFKVATYLTDVHDLMVLTRLIVEETRLAVAAMGLGEALGPVSRPALAVAGSELVYGYLGEHPQVSGQSHVAALRQRIDEAMAL